jgi:hypothetical protein
MLISYLQTDRQLGIFDARTSFTQAPICEFVNYGGTVCWNRSLTFNLKAT